MKATGIVRRIDDLGRVVIPKEIRRTMRIREGDPLEIFTDNDGEVVFKKYSPVGEMTPFALQYADVMSRACGLPVLICDRDHVVAAAGVPKKEFLERRVSGQLEELMEQRRTHIAKASTGYSRWRVSNATPLWPSRSWPPATSPARCASSCRRAAPYPAKATSS